MSLESDAGPARLDRHNSRLILWLGTAIGVACFGYYYAQGLTVAHYDAKAHLLVARRIVDSPTPGYVQMGSHWLPLTHLLYLPFVVFESQYRSGVFPSLLSVCAFALSGWLACRISHRVTGSAAAGLFAGIMLLANANLQYLQSCPLTEPLYMVFLLLAFDGLIRWREGEGGEVPWLTAVWISLGCLCRYEGWYVLGGVLLLLGWDFRTGVMSARKALRTAFLFIMAFLLPVAAHFGYIFWSVRDSFLLRVAQGNPAPSETYKRPLLSLAYHLGELAQIAALLPLGGGHCRRGLLPVAEGQTQAHLAAVPSVAAFADQYLGSLLGHDLPREVLGSPYSCGRHFRECGRIVPRRVASRFFAPGNAGAGSPLDFVDIPAAMEIFTPSTADLES